MPDDSPAVKLRRRPPEPDVDPAPAASGPARPRRGPAVAALAAAMVVTGAGVAGALVVDDDDDADTPSAAEVIAERFPTTYVVTSVIDDAERYQVSVSAVYDAAERYVVTVYRRLDPAQLDAAGLPSRVVGGDDVWTGFDDDQLQAVYVQPSDGDVAVRVSHQGPTPVPLADLTALAQAVGADPTVLAEAG